ncbi:MAG: hypothetical protein NVS4B9_37810 [Ktedonobacteraceae bacterium]
MIFPRRAGEAPEGADIVGKTLRDGEYEVQRVIGQGEVARVFLAIHTTLMLPFALKQIPADQPMAESVIAELDAILGESSDLATPTRQMQPNEFPANDGSSTNRFAREALLLARLHHPSLPMLYDYFYEDNHWYLVMDYIPGTTLNTYLQRYAPLPALEALSCAIQLCDVLDYLHSQTLPVIFPTLQAEDIRVTPTGMIMLVSFGTAEYSNMDMDTLHTNTAEHAPTHAPGTHDMQSAETDISSATGTPTDNPGERQATLHMDTAPNLYSLGLILRDMLYGYETTSEPDISTFLKGLVGLATRTEALNRFQSAHTFCLALERAYQVEEQRTFQEHLGQLHQPGEEDQEVGAWDSPEPAAHVAESPAQVEHHDADKAQPEEDTPPIPMSYTLELEQRRLTRAALQRARQERLQHEYIEVQLASVDESLRQRSSISHSQVSLQSMPPLARIEAPTITIPSIQRFQRIIKINFALALILCLLMISLLVYIRVAQPLADGIDTLLQRIKPAIGGSTGNSGIQSVQNAQNTQGRAPTQAAQDAQGSQTANGGLADNHWQALPSLPNAEADNAAAYIVLQGRAYVYLSGGYHGSSSMPYDRSLYRYDIKAAQWETVAVGHFPGMINNAAAVDEQGRIFFTAGYSSDKYAVSSLLYMYDPRLAVMQRIAPPAQMPFGFAGSILADRQGHLYLAQGFMRAGDQGAQAGTGWYRYDIATGQWHQLAALPVGLGYVFTASDDNGGILLLGGASDAGQHNPSNKIYRYDIATDSWTQSIHSLPQAISGAAGCQPWPGQFVIIGGYDARQNAGTKNSWLLDLHTLKWRALVDLTIGGSALGTAACDGKGNVFLERGTNNPHLPTSDYWEMVVAAGIKIDH